MFNTTLGIPSLELVTQGGTLQIDNGFRGRIRKHNRTIETLTTTGTSSYDKVVLNHDGTERSRTMVEGSSNTTTSSETFRTEWFEKFQ